jgi:phage terminase large subunit
VTVTAPGQPSTQLQIDPTQSVSIMETWRANPNPFIRNILGADPWDVQEEIIQSVKDNFRTAVRSCNAIGKDWLSARIALWWLMCYEEAAVVTTAPSWHQVKDVTWREISSAWFQSKIPLSDSPPSKTEWNLGPKRFGVGLSTDVKERFQGIHNAHILVIVTEASGVPDEILSAIETLCASGDSQA